MEISTKDLLWLEPARDVASRFLPACFFRNCHEDTSFNWTESQPRVLSADHSAAKWKKWVCTSTMQAYLWGELVDYTWDRDQLPAILAGEQLQAAVVQSVLRGKVKCLVPGWWGLAELWSRDCKMWVSMSFCTLHNRVSWYKHYWESSVFSLI